MLARGRALGGVVLSVAAVLATTSCHGDAPVPDPTTTTPTSAPVTTSAPRLVVVRRGVPDAIDGLANLTATYWLDFWGAYGQAIGRPTGATMTGIADLATGAAHTEVENRVAALRAANTHVVGTWRVNVLTATATDIGATVCGTVEREEIEAPVGQEPGTPAARPTRTVRSALVPGSASTWVVSDLVDVPSC